MTAEVVIVAEQGATVGTTIDVTASTTATGVAAAMTMTGGTTATIEPVIDAVAPETGGIPAVTSPGMSGTRVTSTITTGRRRDREDTFPLGNVSARNRRFRYGAHPGHPRVFEWTDPTTRQQNPGAMGYDKARVDTTKTTY